MGHLADQPNVTDITSVCLDDSSYSPETDYQNPNRKTKSIPASSTLQYPPFPPSLPPSLSARRGTELHAGKERPRRLFW